MPNCRKADGTKNYKPYYNITTNLKTALQFELQVVLSQLFADFLADWRMKVRFCSKKKSLA